MAREFEPRSHQLLAAIERAVAARRRPLRVDRALLTALELGVAGLDRDEVAARLRRDHRTGDADAVLDAVFGGAPRLARERQRAG